MIYPSMKNGKKNSLRDPYLVYQAIQFPAVALPEHRRVISSSSPQVCCAFPRKLEMEGIASAMVVTQHR
jgi:hypothetical protein